MTVRTENSGGSNEIIHRGPGTGRIYFLLPALWLMFSVVGIIAFVDNQAQRAQHTFEKRATTVENRFTSLEHGMRSVLESFSAMLEVQDTKRAMDRNMAGHYVNQMRDIYPQIHALELLQKVPRRQLTAFEARESARLGFLFRVHSYDYAVSRTWQPLEDRENYYVITFMAPMSSSQRRMLGLDIASSKAQHQAVREAAVTGQSVVSHPFMLIQGGRAYAMVNPVDRDKSRFAMIVVQTDTLKNSSWLKDLGDMAITIRYGNLAGDDPDGVLYRQEENSEGILESMILPMFTWHSDIRSRNDPFVIDVARQMHWEDLDLPVLFGILLVQFAVLVILSKIALQHYHHDSERRKQELHLVHLANYDGLTGLPNRNLLMDRLQQAILRAHRNSSRLALLFLDLDRFKSVNDTFGHEAGDRVLVATARAIRDTVRAQDTVARLAGDEFIVLLEKMESREETDKIARKLTSGIRASLDEEYRQLGVGVSIGIAMYPEDGEEATSLLRHADTHMYDSKRDRQAVSFAF